MQFDRRQIGVSLRMKRVDILRDDAADEPPLRELADSMVGSIGLRFVETRPAQEAACPISLPGFVVADEFVVVDGPVALVLGVCSVLAAVVGQPRCYRYARPGEQDGARFRRLAMAGRRSGGEELGEGCRRARQCRRRFGDDDWWWQGARVGDSHQGFGHVQTIVKVKYADEQFEQRLGILTSSCMSERQVAVADCGCASLSVPEIL